MNHPRVSHSSAIVTLTLALAVGVAGCDGPPIPSAVEGEPICPDFEIGAARSMMEGSLRLPVTMRIKEGETTIAYATLHGRRSEKDGKTRIALTDGDSEYTIEWAQCENEHAPRAVEAARAGKGSAKYECGKETVYKTEPLVTKKGDPASHTVAFPAPPSAACWEPEAPPKAPPPPPPPPPAPPPAEDSDAGPGADAG